MLTSQNTCIGLVKNIQNIDTSILKLEQCITTLKNDTTAYVNSICLLADLYVRKSQHVKSEKILLQLIPTLKSNKHKLLQGLVYNNLANNYKFSRDVSNALTNYLLAAQIFESEKSKADLIRLYTDIAEYYRSIGFYNDAKRFIRKAYDTYQVTKSNETSKLIRVFNRYAAIANESIAGDSSILLSFKALKLSKEIGDLNSEAISLNEIGFIMKNRNNLDSSRKCYERAIELWTESGSDIDAIHAKYNLAMLLSHNNFPKETVIPRYLDIINTVRKKNIDYPLDQAYFGLSDCYFFLGDSLNYYRIRRKAYEAVLTKNQKIFDVEVNNIKEKYENEKYRNKISQVSNELKASEKNLTQKQNENRIIYLSLVLSSILLVIIGILAKRIYDNNKALQIKNKEKDSLIQEIHHRVKNNLQFVGSLLNMQINSSKNVAEIDTLNDASRRIRSMALVHEMLYNQNDVKGIEINKYISELISSINDVVNSKKIPIQFTIDCDTLDFETSNAIALGMITSELVSNSIKYAFTKTKKPQIDISLKIDLNNKTIRFIVSDNGSGLKAQNNESHEKLGLRLISIFSRQLKGDYSFKNENGLTYNLIFKLRP